MIGKHAKGGRKLFPLIAFLLLAAALAFAASIFRFSLHNAPVLPFWDHWVLFIELASGHGHYSLAQLWQLHGEHRIVLPRLFLLADLYFFKATGTALIVSILTFQAFHAILFCLAACSLRHLSAWIRACVCALLIVFFFSPVQIENFVWPYQISFILGAFFSSFSLFLFAISYRNSPPWRYLGFAACVLAALCSTLSLASGLVVWPLLMLLCLVLRVERKVLAAITISAILIISAYFYNYHSPAIHADPLVSLKHPSTLVVYLLAYLGGSWSVFGFTAAVSLGVAGVLAASFLLFTRLVRPSSSKPVEIFFLSIIVLSVIVGLITGAGRINFGLDQAFSSRYQSIALAFWAALASWAISLAARQNKGRIWASALMIAFTTVAAAPLFKLQFIVTPYKDRAENWRVAQVSAISDVDDRQFMRTLSPDLGQTEPALEYLRQHRLSIFSSNLYPQLGSLFLTHYKIDAGLHCVGAVDNTTRLLSQNQGGFRLSGWAWNATSRRPFEHLVLVNEHGVISGFGVGEYPYKGKTASAIPGGASGWFGYTRIESTTDRVHIYGVADDGKNACMAAKEEFSKREVSYSSSVNPIVLQLAKTYKGILRAGAWWLDIDDGYRSHAIANPIDIFGQAGDVPVIGDWDGRGKLRIGVFRAGQWMVDINGNGKWDPGVDRNFNYGRAGDIPVTGDWDGHGKLRVGVFRDGQWLVDTNGNNKWEPGIDETFAFGQAGDIPVIGDWDGTGKLRIGVFRNGQWRLDVDGDHKWTAGSDRIDQFGLAGDTPVVGNWDYRGKLRIGVFRQGHWLLDMNGNYSWDALDDEDLVFGQPGDSASLFQWPLSAWPLIK
jgi:hypothetical protein